MIVTVSDFHLSPVCPSRRADPNFIRSQLEKLEYVVSYPGAKAVVFAGDLGHSFDWHSVDFFRSVHDILKKADPQIIAIIGNHDVRGRLWSDWVESTLGFLQQLKVVRVPDDHTVYIAGRTSRAHETTAEIPGGWLIAPFHSDHPNTARFVSGELSVSDVYPKVELHPDLSVLAVVHHPIGPNGLNYCQGWSDTRPKGADAVCFGDIHLPFGPVNHNGTVVYNSGCVVRRSVSERFIIPCLAVLTRHPTDPRQVSVRFESIPHTPHEDLFPIVTNKKEVNFADLIQDVPIVTEDPRALLIEQGKLRGTSTEALDLTLETLEEVKR